MQAQPSKPTKPTASQIMAAKKAQKRDQKIERVAKAQIGNKAGDRNKASEREFKQYQNRKAMRIGEPDGKDVNINDAIKNLLHYQALIYSHETVSAGIFEKLIRAMRVVAAIYADANLNDAANQAQSALEKSAAMADASPNQRRVLLRPLLNLAKFAEHYATIIPAKTCEHLGSYCASVQVALYATAFYDRPIEHLEATNKIINGESLRTLAKQYGIKENQLRIAVLDAAWCLYKIADAFNPVEEPDSIPKLRSQEWQNYGDPEKFYAAIRYSNENFLIPFENHTGISLIDYNKFRRDIIKIGKMH